ncbi:MAG: hypothetical protein KGO92_08840 [Bacteroidota bacterium]|nr:hypothetical protein [Bacteroidota bacterium]
MGTATTRKLFGSFVLLLVFFLAHAQKPVYRYGYLKDSATQEPIVLASVTNLNTKTTVMTSKTGRFRIELKENEILSFAAVDYHFDTIHYTGKYITEDTLSLFLTSLTHSLGNVTVSGRRFSRYQLDSMERRSDFLHVVSYKIPTVSQANSGAGIALNIDHFSRHERNKRKAWAFFEANEEEAYINYRFPAALVAKYSGLKNEQLQDFMQQYRPDYNWLRKNTTEEDVLYYINEKLKSYHKVQ